MVLSVVRDIVSRVNYTIAQHKVGVYVYLLFTIWSVCVLIAKIINVLTTGIISFLVI